MLPLQAPHGAQLFWLAREGAAHGQRLQDAVRARIGPSGIGGGEQPLAEIDIDQDILWEQASAEQDGLYAWVAGEAGAVMAIRRHLVKTCGIDRRAITFMGYWRHGKVLD
ncbi:Siderophore-interacting protein [compost metagenome]